MGTPSADTGRFFDLEAERYDAAHDRDDVVGYALRTRISAALRLLGPRPGAVLDCGMGPGRLLSELERRGWSIAGLDVSSEMVALARERLPQSAERLLLGRLESVPFPSGSFDAVVATGVLEYVEDVPRALAEVARVLRPGGLFVVSMPNPRAIRTLWRHRVVYPGIRAVKARLHLGSRVPLPRPGWLSVRRLENLLDAAGLEVELLEYLGFLVLPAPLDALLPSVAVRVARRLEGVGPRARPFLGAQFIVTARKAGEVAAPPPFI